MIFDDKTPDELFRSIEAEVAKAVNEMRCARRDLEQAEARMKFALATVHYLRQRYEDK